MGKVLSTVSKPIKNFNVENRAIKAVERQAAKPVAAPKHPTTQSSFDKLKRDSPEVLNVLKTKNEALHERLKLVYVESTGPPPDETLVSAARKNLPKSKAKLEDSEYGYLIPNVIPEGKLSIVQLFEFIGKHQNDPKVYTAAHIASEYKLDLVHTQQILRYYQSYHMYVPKKIRDKMAISGEEVELLAKPPRLFSGKSTSDRLESSSDSLPTGSINDTKLS